MAASEPTEPVAAELEGFNEKLFREAFRVFHHQFSVAMDAGVEVGLLLVILEEEGVQLPDWIRQVL